MEPTDDQPDRRLIIARRDTPSAYSSRVRASRRNARLSEVVVNPERFTRQFVETLQQEFSVSVSPFPTEEEQAVLEKYAPGSPERLINAIIDRIEMQTEAYREDGRVSREINARGQQYAFGTVVVVLLTACLFAWLGHPREAAGLAIALVLALAVAFLAGERLNTVVPWLFRNPSADSQKSGVTAVAPREPEITPQDDSTADRPDFS